MGPFSVYVAAPFVEREAAREVASALRKAGIEVTSRWIESHLEEGTLSFDAARGEAEADLDDIESADALVLVDRLYGCSTGRNFEFGYAVARGKTVVRIGDKPRHIFHHLVSVINVPTVEEAIDVLKREVL